MLDQGSIGYFQGQEIDSSNNIVNVFYDGELLVCILNDDSGKGYLASRDEYGNLCCQCWFGNGEVYQTLNEACEACFESDDDTDEINLVYEEMYERHAIEEFMNATKDLE